jgi:hypothetical protein
MKSQETIDLRESVGRALQEVDQVSAHCPIIAALPADRATPNAIRLPAKQLEGAILDQLVALLRRTNFVRDSVAETLADHSAQHPDHQTEIESIETEIKSLNATLERYVSAFETDSLPEIAYGERIAVLNREMTALRARHHELVLDQQDDANFQPPTEEDLRALLAQVGRVIRYGSPSARKALLQDLVSEVRIVSRAEIYPTFALPMVRPPTPYDNPAKHDPNQRTALNGRSRGSTTLPFIPLPGFEPGFPP